MSRFPTSPDSLNRNPSPSFNMLTRSLKDDFKTFALLQQQESIISKVESNLQKTLELFRDQSGADLLLPQQKDTRKSISPNKYQLDKLESIESPHRRFHGEDLLASKRSGQSSNKKSRNGSNNENVSPKLGSSSRRQKNSATELRIDDLTHKEVEGHSPVQVARKRKNQSEEHEKPRSARKLNSSSKKKNKSTSMSNSVQQREDISSYQEEISELKEGNKRLREALEHQTSQADTTINELERENYELKSRINQSHNRTDSQDLFNSQSQIERDREELSDLPKFLVDQIIKDKNDLETKYNDLFISYSILLEHNKALSQKIETLEKENERKVIENVQDTVIEKSFGNQPELSFKDNINVSLTQENSIGKIRKNKDRDRTISNSLFLLLDEEKALLTGRKSLMDSALKEESLLKSTEKRNLLDELASERKPVVDNKTKKSPAGRAILGAKTNNESVAKGDKDKKLAGNDIGATCKTEGNEKENKPKFSLPIKKNLPQQKVKKETEKDALASTSRTKLTQRSNPQENLLTSPKQSVKDSCVSPTGRDTQRLKQGLGLKKSPSQKENIASASQKQNMAFPQPKKPVLYSKGVKRG